MPEDDKLKIVIEACPFCSHAPVLRKGKFIQAPVSRVMIGCVNETCEVWVHTKWVPTLLEAITAWNTRVSVGEEPKEQDLDCLTQQFVNDIDKD